GAAPRVSLRKPLTPSAIDRVIATCLAANPDNRFHSAHDLGLQLKWIAAGSPDERVSGKRPLARYLPWAIAAVAVLLAIVSLARGTPQRVAADLAPITFLVHPVDGAPFPIGPMFLTVLPDGRELAFVAGEVSVGQRLYLRPMNSTDGRWLQGTENVDQPFWSADSRSIAFFDRIDRKLKRVDVA